MDNSQRIANTSRRIKKICSGLIFCLPVYFACYWLFFNPKHSTEMRMLPVPVIDNLPASTRFYAFLIEMITVSVIIYGLLKLRELFRLYENGMIFTEKNVSCFRSMGRILIAWVVCDVIRNTLLSMVLAMNNPSFPGSGVIQIHFGHIACVFVGIAILTIAWVMDEARKIHEDQSLFI